MAKANITQYSSTPSSNTDINNINIDENCPASGLNNAIRELMAHLKNVDTGSQALTALSVTGNVSVGGTFTSTGIDDNATSTSVTIDSSQRFMVGKTSTGLANVGAELDPTGQLKGTASNVVVQYLNRTNSDGAISEFRKDNTTVGTIGTLGGGLRITSSLGTGLYLGASQLRPMNSAGSTTDGSMDIGQSSERFKDLYLSGGAYLGGTGSANYLDDYEEGTWTPNIGGNSTYNEQTGKYIKVGHKVTLWFTLRINQRNSPAAPYIVAGNPFTNNTSVGGSGVVHYFNSIQNSAVVLTARVDASGGNINLSGATGSATTVANVNHDWAGNGSAVYGFVTFFSQ